MKYFFTLFIFIVALFNYTYASSCINLEATLVRRDENDSVLLLQNFLSSKGYLKAKPNGYYGVGTFQAVKSYQKDNGIRQTGNAGPATRAKIKEQSCGTTSITNTTTKGSTQAVTVNTSTSPIKKDTLQGDIVKKSLSNNDIRRNDGEKILKALYAYFKDSRGVWPVAVTATTSRELCVTPRVLYMEAMAVATDTAQVVKTPDSKCKDYVDISFLESTYFMNTPRDPSLATTSNALGYMITRDAFGEITLFPKKVDNNDYIRVRCNFNGGCESVTHVSQEEYKAPVIETLSRNIIIKDSLLKDGIVINGRNITATNTLIIQSKSSQKKYTVRNSTSSDTNKLIIPTTITREKISCGAGCEESLPIGEYSVQVINQGGESNLLYFSIVPFTTATLSLRSNTTAQAKTTNVKLATISISGGTSLTLTTLTLTSTTTALQGTSTPNTSSKITQFKVVDPISNTTITGNGTTFNLSNTHLEQNSSRFYDVYANIGDILVSESAFMTYGGTFTAKDTLYNAEVSLPIKEFYFSVSP
jgi:hypothetical protein